MNENKIQSLSTGAAKPIKITNAQASQIVNEQNIYQEQLAALEKKDDLIQDINTTGYVKPTEMKKYYYYDDEVKTNQVDAINSVAVDKKDDKKAIIIMSIIIAVIVIFLIFEILTVVNK